MNTSQRIKSDVRKFLLGLLVISSPFFFSQSAKSTELSASPSKASSAKTAKTSSIKSSEVQDLPDSNLIVFNNTPVLLDEPPFPLFRLWKKITQTERTEYLWTCFLIQVKPETVKNAKASIIASELGHATFAHENTNLAVTNQASSQNFSQQLCKPFRGSDADWTKQLSQWSSFLELPLDRQPKRIIVRLPVDLVPQLGSSIEGKIQILESKHKTIEIPVKVERASSSPIVVGFQWVAGITIPAFLAWGLGVFATHLNSQISSRNTQNHDFKTFKDHENEKLNHFFTAFYSTIYSKPDQEFAHELQRGLRDQKILENIPQKQRTDLEKAIQAGKRQTIALKLMELFSEWKQEIQNPSNQ